MAARRRRRQPKREKPERVSDPNGLTAWIHRYLTWMAIQNYSPRTVENRRRTLRAFVAWCAERDLTKPEEITKPILERYQRALFYQRKRDGKPLSFRSQHHHLVPLRQLFKWLARENAIPWNPASELDLPRLEKRLPKHVLTASEAAVVLAQPNLGDLYGIRDRAILEVFYSTGMRRLELVGLAVTDLDAERGTVIVRQGKGKKDRMLPVGESAVEWCERYLDQVRPQLVVPPDDGALFLSREGGSLSPRTLTALVGHYVDQAQIGKHGACHLFRHTMATLMLENGADIRFIQQMLGHANLTTTEIYTQVSIKRLQQIHALTHPTARKDAAPRPRPHLDAGAELDAIPATEDELLSSLAAEADEEDADATA